MKKTVWIAPLLAFGLAATPALAAEEPTAVEQEQARIPFVNHGGIRDWQLGDDRETLYIQDRSRKWYKATLLYAPVELNSTLAIGFDTGAIDTLDRFSSVIVGDQKIPLMSLVAIEGEPPKKGEED